MGDVEAGGLQGPRIEGRLLACSAEERAAIVPAQITDDFAAGEQPGR